MRVPPELAATLCEAGHIAVLTGAGASADSGVPTFRDAQTGLWSRFDPRELATPEAFRTHPTRVWEWYAWRRRLIAGVEPNAGHYALAAMEAACPRFTLITQNVDGLHQLAGSRTVHEFHGNIHANLCFEEHRRLADHEMLDGVPPRCRYCQAMVRPAVVWFGEPIDEKLLQVADQAARNCDVLIWAGTAAEVYPAAGLIEVADTHGAVLVEINPQPSALSSLADYTLRERTAVALPALAATMSSEATQ